MPSTDLRGGELLEQASQKERVVRHFWCSRGMFVTDYLRQPRIAAGGWFDATMAQGFSSQRNASPEIGGCH